jgi:hypothetical protein
MNPLVKKIDIQQIFLLQQFQYTEKLVLSDSVPGGSTRMGKVSITNHGDFLCTRITGTFETLTNNGAIVDDGVCHLRGKIVDQSTNRPLTNDYVPLDLILTPGRVKSSNSTGVLTDAAANGIFWPDDFVYCFSKNSDISFDVKNDSNTTIAYNVCFHGIRLISKK